MAAPTTEKSFEQLTEEALHPKVKRTPAVVTPKATAAPREKSFEELTTEALGPTQTPADVLASPTVPVLPHLGAGAAPAPPPAGAFAPEPSYGPPRPAGPPDYAQQRQSITASAAELARQKPELDREQARLDQRFADLEKMQRELDKGAAIARDHPAEWDEGRSIALEIKRQSYESQRQQFLQEQAAARERVHAFGAAQTRIQGDEARLKFAPATAKIPQAPIVALPTFPEEQLFLGAEDALRRTPIAVAFPGRHAQAAQHMALAAGKFHEAAKPRWQQLMVLGPQLTAAADALEPFRKQLKAGTLSPADERRVVQAGRALQYQIKLYTDAQKRLSVQDGRAVKFINARLVAGLMPHGQDKWPEEMQPGPPSGWFARNAVEVYGRIKAALTPQETAATKRADVYLGAMMITGESPVLPPNPGRTPEEKRHYINLKDQLVQQVKQEHDPRNPTPVYLLPSTDPFARQLLPILRAQYAARQKAFGLANVAGAMTKDFKTLAISYLVGEVLGPVAGLVLGKIPGVAAILAEPLFGAGAKAFLARGSARIAVAATRTGVAFTGFGSTHAGLTAFGQGKGLHGSLKEAARAAPPSFGAGAAVGGGLGLLGVLGEAAGVGYRRLFPGGGAAPEAGPKALGPGPPEPPPPGPQGPLNLPEEYRMGPSPQTAPEASAQISTLEKITPTAEAELQAATAAGQDAAKAAAAAPNAAKSLLGPGVSPESLTAEEIQAQAKRLVDHLKGRAADLTTALPELTRVDAEVAAGITRAGGVGTGTATSPVQTPTRPTVFEPDVLPEEAGPLVSQGRPASPGGYQQSPRGLEAGPAVSAPAGTPVPLRYQTPSILAGLLTGLQEDGSPPSLAAIPVVQGYILRSQQYEGGRQLPPHVLEQVTAAFNDPKEPARVAFDALSRAAGNARDPELAARLAGAAKQVHDDFGEFIASTLPDAQQRDTGVDIPPPFVSPYRTLSGAERQSLPPEVRRALLIQDIANSTRVLHPGAAPFFTVPGSTAQLQGQADNLFRLAQRQALQTEVAHAIPQPGAQVAAPPAPAPSTVPGVTVPGPKFGDRPFTTQPSPVATEQKGKLSAPPKSLSRRHLAVVRALVPEGGATRVSLQRRFRLNRSQAGQLFAELQGEGILGAPGRSGHAALALSPDEIRALLPARVTQDLKLAARLPERAESLLARAARLVADSGRANAAGLARRLGISPDEAEALLKELEKVGVVSAPDASGRRRVLMNHGQAEDAVSAAETQARRKAGGYVPVPTPAPKVTITQHAPQPKAADKPAPTPAEKPAPVEGKPPAKPEAKSEAKPAEKAKSTGKTRLSRAGAVVDVEDGIATVVKPAPKSNLDPGDQFDATAEELEKKGWEREEGEKPAAAGPKAPAGPKPASEAAEETAGEAKPKAKAEEERPKSAPAEPEEAPAGEEGHVEALEKQLAGLPDLTPSERGAMTPEERAAWALGQFGDVLNLVPELSLAGQEAVAGTPLEQAAFRDVLKLAEGAVQATADELAGGFTKAEIRDLVKLKPGQVAPSPASAQDIEAMLLSAGWTPERILEAGEKTELGLHGPPAPHTPGVPEQGRQEMPSAREKPPELTDAQIAAVEKAGLSELRPGQRVGVKDIDTEFTLEAPEPRLGPYAWTATITTPGLTPGVGDRPVPTGAVVFVNFAENTKRYVLDPGPPAPPPPREELLPEEKVAPPWAKVGARFEAVPTGHIYQLLSRDAAAGTWTGQIVDLAPYVAKQIEKATNPSFVPLQVGRLDLFTDKGLHFYEPLPGTAGQAQPEPVAPAPKGPQPLPDTPVPVTEERNDLLPTAPPVETQVKERGAKPKAAGRVETPEEEAARQKEQADYQERRRQEMEAAGVKFKTITHPSGAVTHIVPVEENPELTERFRQERAAQVRAEAKERLERPNLLLEDKHAPYVTREEIEAVRARLTELEAISERLHGKPIHELRYTDAASTALKHLSTRLTATLEALAMRRQSVAKKTKQANTERVAELEQQLKAALAQDYSAFDPPKTKLDFMALSPEGKWVGFSKEFSPEEARQFEALADVKPQQLAGRVKDGKAEWKRVGHLFEHLHPELTRKGAPEKDVDYAAKRQAVFGQEPAAPKVAPVAEPAAVTLPPEQLGKATVFTADNKDYEGRWAVVEVGDLVTSHDDSLVANAAYPQQYQPRERDELAPINQVIDIMNNLDPKRLGANVLAGHGAPIVSPSLLVETGNGRTIALRRLYRMDANRIPNYRGFLRSNAAEFGLTPAAIAKLKNPVLVRIRTQDLSEAERLAFVHAANAHTTLKPTAKATAKFVAARLTPRLMEHFDPGVDLDLNTEQNRTWVKGLLGLFGPNDLGDMIEEKETAFGKVTQLTDLGQTLAMNAVFYYAYGDEGLLATITASAADNPIKRVTGAMLRSAGIWSVWRDRIKSGHAYDLDVTPDLLAVVARIAELRKRTLNPKKVAAPLFGDVELSPLQEVIFEAIQDRKGSQPKIAGFLADIADLGMQVGDPFADNNEPAIFDAGEKEIPTTREIVEAARAGRRSYDDGQAGLFLEAEAGPGSAKGSDGPEAHATSTGPLGSGDREGEALNKPYRDLSTLWVEAYPELARYLHPDTALDLPDGLWFQARFGTGMPLIWNQRFQPPVETVDWMVEGGHALRRRFDLLAHRLLTPDEQKHLGAVGLMVHPAMGGLNLTWSSGEQDIYANPFSAPGDTGNVYRGFGAAGNDPRTEARRIALTMVHEIAHFRVKEEGDKLWDEMDRMVGQIGLPAFRQIVGATTDILTKGGTKHGFSPQYQKAREAYAAAVGAHRRLDFSGPDAEASGGGSADALPSEVRRGQGRAGKHQGRGPTAQATSVTPGGQPMPDEGQEKQWQQSYVPIVKPELSDPKGFFQSMRDLWHGLTREFPELKAGGYYAQLQSLLHDAMKAAAVGREEAQRQIDLIFRPLSPEDQGLFERALYVFDLDEDLRRLGARLLEENQRLTAGEAQAEADKIIQFPTLTDPETGEETVVWTPKNVRAAKAELARRVAASPAVARQLAARKKMVEEVKTEFLYWLEAATGKKREMDREDYFHHQVLLYAMGQDYVGNPAGRGGVRVITRGFTKVRAGTTLAHNSAYVASELDWLSQAQADIPLYKLVAHLRGSDRAHIARGIAKAENDKLLMSELAKKAKAQSLIPLPDGEFMEVTAAELYKDMTRAIGQAFYRYGRLAAAGNMTRHPDGRFDELIEQLAEVHTLNQALAVEAMNGGAPFVPEHISSELKHGIHEYGAWIITESKRAGYPLPGSGPAGAMFKAVAYKHAEVDKILGARKQTEDTVADKHPDFKDFHWWQPQPGQRIFSKLAVVDRIGEAFLDELAEEVKITKDDLRKVMVLGGPNLRLLLPDPIVRTLTQLDLYKDHSPVGQFLEKLWRPLKYGKLYNPVHSVAFAAQNVFDFQTMLIGGRADAIPELLPALKMVARYLFKKEAKERIPEERAVEEMLKLPSGAEAKVTYDERERGAEFRAFLKNGPLFMKFNIADIDPTLVLQVEGKDWAQKLDAGFANLQAALAAGRKGQILRATGALFTLLGPQATTLLDASMRFAAYMAFMKEMAESEDNLPKNVGYALKQEIEGISGVGRDLGERLLDQRRRRAWLMADEMMVAYDKTPPALVKGSNAGLFWFIRYFAGNIRRFHRLFANPAWENGPAQKTWSALVQKAGRELVEEVRTTGGKGPPRTPPPFGGGGGKGGGGGDDELPPPPDLPKLPLPGSPRVAAVQAGLMLAAYATARVPQLIIQTLRPDLERGLPPDVRDRAHLIVGVDPWNGQTMAFTRLSPFDDVLAISDPYGVIEEVRRGKIPWYMAPLKMATYNPVKQMLSTTGPATEIYDILRSLSSYPDAMHPRYRETSWERLFDLMGYGTTYRWLKNERGETASERAFAVLGIHEYSRMESAYFEIRDRARDYLGEGRFSGPAKNAKSAALYQFYQAAKAGDAEAAGHFLLTYKLQGGDRDGMRVSLGSHDPLLKMNDDQAADFVRKLSEQDRVRVKLAYLHFKSEVDGVTKRRRPLPQSVLNEADAVRWVLKVRGRIKSQIHGGDPIHQHMKEHPEERQQVRDAERALEEKKHPRRQPVGVE